MRKYSFFFFIAVFVFIFSTLASAQFGQELIDSIKRNVKEIVNDPNVRKKVKENAKSTAKESAKNVQKRVIDASKGIQPEQQTAPTETVVEETVIEETTETIEEDGTTRTNRRVAPSAAGSTAVQAEDETSRGIARIERGIEIIEQSIVNDPAHTHLYIKKTRSDIEFFNQKINPEHDVQPWLNKINELENK